MTAWRIDLTVLADLSASMFAACFMILLIFLSLVQDTAEPPRQPVEASQALHLAHRPVLNGAGMVELLYDHDAGRSGSGIDLFEDRIELTSTSGTMAVDPAVLAGLAGPVRLYVFSNRLYGDAIAALGEGDVSEMSVPQALRDPADPSRAWNPDFLKLEGQGLDPASFRRGLAAILEGGAEAGGNAGGAPAYESSPSSLLERLKRWLSVVVAIVPPLVAVFAIAWIETRRRRVT